MNVSRKVIVNVLIISGILAIITAGIIAQVTRSVETPQKQTPINVLFPNQPEQTIITQTVTQENQKEVRRYQLLALSGSMPVTYVINKVQLIFTPYLIKPLNQVDYVNNTSKNGLYFLFSAGASVTF